jgi:hypothetical protein
MSDELNVIKLFLDSRETYETWVRPVVKLPSLDRTISFIIKNIGDYYDRYPTHDKILPADFKEFIDYQHPVHKEKPIVFDLIDQADGIATSVDLIRLSLDKMTEASFAAEICSLLTPVIEGSKYNVMPQAFDMIEDFNGYVGVVDDTTKLEPYYKSIKELKEQNQQEQDLSWPLSELDRIIGAPRRKTSGAFFARPDAGKTTFGVNTACKWAASLHFRKKDGVILYCQNEEAMDLVWERALCSMNDCDKEYLYNNETAMEDQFWLRGGRRLVMIEDVYHIAILEQLLKKYSPRAVIIDQTPKLNIPGGHLLKGTAKLQMTYQRVRELSKKYDTSILNLSQATASNGAANRMYLGLDDMHASKTDVPGELDYAIGCGFKDEPGYENQRFINVCKNKLMNGLHWRFQCVFDGPKARYKDN